MDNPDKAPSRKGGFDTPSNVLTKPLPMVLAEMEKNILIAVEATKKAEQAASVAKQAERASLRAKVAAEKAMVTAERVSEEAIARADIAIKDAKMAQAASLSVTQETVTKTENLRQQSEERLVEVMAKSEQAVKEARKAEQIANTASNEVLQKTETIRQITEDKVLEAERKSENAYRETEQAARIALETSIAKMEEIKLTSEQAMELANMALQETSLLSNPKELIKRLFSSRDILVGIPTIILACVVAAISISIGFYLLGN